MGRACDPCRGSGYLDVSGEMSPCPYCGATGWRLDDD